MNNELLIPFESFSIRGVQKDTEMKTKSKSSFFYNIYLQTYKLIEQICHENEQHESDENKCNCCSICEQDLNSIQNIIAFTGRRGTGKTSAMLSIVDSLILPKISEDFKKKTNGQNSDEKYDFISKNYTTFPYIDAAMMSQNEDIFEIVLAKMAMNVKKHFGTTYDRKYKYYEQQAAIDSVLEKINKVYDHYSSLMGLNSDSSKIGYNFMELVTNKHNVRNGFIELVKEYTNLFGTETKKDCYLIICIDDIDMSLPNHMSIMQCIHQYFMIPKVIVMVSLNFELLNATLQKDFYSKMQISGANDSEHEHQMHLTRSQTYDFLKKVIPPDMRITMPSWKKRDYIELFPSKIDFSSMLDVHGDPIYKEIYSRFPNLKDSMLMEKIRSEKTLTPKQLIMILLADRTKCFLDICGYKMHFMQPDSLRSLNDLFYLFYNMENIFPLENNKEKDNGIYYSKRESNRKILLDYLNFKMLYEFEFDPEKMSFINSLLASPVERRGRMVWNYYHTLLNQKRNRKRIITMYNDDFYKEESARHKADDYSFGELFRCLFTATRLGVFSSDFVKFILASFSFTMPQFIELQRKTEKYYKEEWQKKEPQYNTYWYPRIREAFSYSMIGSWCQDLFGKRYVNVVIRHDSFKNAIEYFQNKEDHNSVLNSLLGIILQVFTLCSCSSNDYIIIDQNNNDTEYTIHAKIDPTAFILNSLKLEKRVATLRFKLRKKEDDGQITFRRPRSLFELLWHFIILSFDKEDDITWKFWCKDCKVNKKKAESIFMDYVIKFREQKLTTDESFPLFLLKHTDMTYSVIKRVIHQLLYSTDNVVTVKQNNPSTSNDPEKVIHDFYKYFFQELEKQEEKYFSINEINKSAHFSSIFSNNSIVKMFDVNDEDKDKRIQIAIDTETKKGRWLYLKKDNKDIDKINTDVNKAGKIIEIDKPIKVIVSTSSKNLKTYKNNKRQ